MSYKTPAGRWTRHNPRVPDIGPRRIKSFCAHGEQSFVPPMIPDPNDPHQPTALDIRGKIGQTVFQAAIPPPWSKQAGEPKQLQRRRHVMPRDPRTLKQLLCRARWAAGMAAWENLTGDEQLSYNSLRVVMDGRILGVCYFMREWCRLHSVEEYHVQALLWSAQPELPFLSSG